MKKDHRIHHGEVDTLFARSAGDQIFTLESADYPYRILLETMREGVAAMSAEGIIIYCNNRFAEMIKMRLPAVINSSIYDLISPADQKLFDGIFKEWGSGEISLRAKDKTLIPVYLSCTSFELGDTLSACVVVTDLAKQKRNENKLKDEKLSRSILDQATEAIIVCDENGQITRASQLTHELCGKNVLFKHFNDIFSLRIIRKGTLSSLFSISTPLKGKIVLGVSVSFHRDDGNAFDLLLNARPLLDQQKKIHGAVVTLVDISDRKRAEEALHQSEERYRTTLEDMEEGYYEVDLAGNFTFVNDAICRHLGYTKEELIGMNNRQYTDKENARKVFEAFNKIYRTGESGKVLDYGLIGKDGTERNYEMSAFLIRDSKGKSIGFRGISRDITERKRSEEALKLKTENLEETNTALKVLLKRLEDDRSNFEGQILSNINELVLPYVMKLKNRLSSKQHVSLLTVIESNLGKVTSSFLQNLKLTHYNLTHREIDIATLVCEGKSIKEIAELLSITTRTVEFYRNSLRKKLGLNNKKINLRSHLLTIQ
jgi:PAS domain S-box-containing protein